MEMSSMCPAPPMTRSKPEFHRSRTAGKLGPLLCSASATMRQGPGLAGPWAWGEDGCANRRSATAIRDLGMYPSPVEAFLTWAPPSSGRQRWLWRWRRWAGPGCSRWRRRPLHCYSLTGVHTKWEVRLRGGRAAAAAVGGWMERALLVQVTNVLDHTLCCFLSGWYLSSPQAVTLIVSIYLVQFHCCR